MLKLYIISILIALTSFYCNTPKFDVVGIAKVEKHAAYILTDDSLRYFLDRVEEGEAKFPRFEKYLNKRVRVKGRLVIREYKPHMNNTPEITAIPQQRYGKWKFIENPKWRLAE
jgi:hypothetical protein